MEAALPLEGTKIGVLVDRASTGRRLQGTPGALPGIMAWRRTGD